MEDVSVKDIAEIARLEAELATKAVKILGGGLDKIIAFFIAALRKEREMGKTNLKQILEKVVNQGGEVMFFQFDESKLKEFKVVAKKYGLLYSIVKDKNKSDGMMEIIFHSSHSSQVERVMKELGVGRIISEEEYINNIYGKTKSNEKEAATDKKKEQESKQDLNDTTIKDKKPNKKDVVKENSKSIKDKLKEFEQAGQVQFKEKVKKRAKDTVKKVKPGGK